MNKTSIDIAENTRNQAITLLQQTLADSIDIMAQAKQAHWNVKGPNFIGLHELFDKINEDSEEWVDLIAERIAQFGGTAEGTIQAVSKRSQLPAYPLNISQGKDHVAALAKGLAAYGAIISKAIDHATELKDAGTADIYTEISREADKYLWFVEAHQVG
jgi:starvation-inducible DNA-binding protein